MAGTGSRFSVRVMFSFLPEPNDLGPDPEPPGTRMDFLMSQASPPPAHVPAPPRRALSAGSRRPAKRVLVAGGGPAALEAALSLHELAGSELSLHLVAPLPTFVYRPLSVVEPFGAGHARTYLLSTLEQIGVEVHRGALASVDAEARSIRTAAGIELGYDALVVATGAGARPAVPHATTFTGSAEAEAIHGILQDMEGGWCERIAFVAPPGANWTLPLYELALQTAERASDLCLDRVRITLVTHESRPLDVFGSAGVQLAERLLAAAGIELITAADPRIPAVGVVVARPGARTLEVDRVIALPVPVGRPVAGLPCDEDGFLAVDTHGRVGGVSNVYAAGDCTAGPIKQGGLATQQANAACEALLADVGLRHAADHHRSVLRAMLIAGDKAWYLRAGHDGPAEASERALWWPPSKIAGRRLAPFLDGLDAEASTKRVERRLADRAGVRKRAAVGREGFVSLAEAPR